MKNSQNFLKSTSGTKGYSSMGVILVLGAITTGGLSVVLNKNNQILKNSAKTVAADQVQSEMQKILSMAGFLVSNNYIRCKESTKHCSWDPLAKAEKFGLSGMKGDSNGLHFTNIDMAFINPEVNSKNRIKVLGGALSFRLLDSRSNSELKQLLGKRKEELKKLDRDHSVVVATARIKYQISEKNYLAERNYAVRRPIGLIKVDIDTGQCSSRCESASSQNPFPSCAGPQTLDPNSVVDVTGTITNLGPGTIYALKFRREVCLRRTMNRPFNRSNNCDQAPVEYLEIPMKILAPKATVNFSDTIPCKTFQETVASNNRSGTVKYQHVASGGRVSYVLDAEDDDTEIDPYRQNERLIGSDVNLPGRVGTVYVVPPH